MPSLYTSEAAADLPFEEVIHQRRNALLAMLLFTLPSAGLMLVINMWLAAGLLVLLNLALLGGALACLFLLRRRDWLDHLSIGYLGLLHTNIIVGVARPDLHPGVTHWLTALPVLPYLLLRYGLAFPLALASVLAAAAAYYAGLPLAPQRLDPLYLVHVGLPALGLFLASHCYAMGRSRSIREMRLLVSQDALTGLWNREKLIREIALEGKRRRRTGDDLSLILMDLDNFKDLNDRCGHDAGDAALIFVARLLEGRLRETDLICRIGGEEFAVLLPDTDLTGAMRVAEELRHSLEVSEVNYREERIKLTMSAGVVEMGRDGDDWLQLYRAADALLYKCKARGRNCVLGSTPWQEVRHQWLEAGQGREDLE